MNFLFPLLGFLDVGTPEVLLILFVSLLLFGGKKLPELAKGLGKAVREFKEATSGVEAEIKRAMDETRPATKPSAVSSFDAQAAVPIETKFPAISERSATDQSGRIP